MGGSNLKRSASFNPFQGSLAQKYAMDLVIHRGVSLEGVGFGPLVRSGFARGMICVLWAMTATTAGQAQCLTDDSQSYQGLTRVGTNWQGYTDGITALLYRKGQSTSGNLAPLLTDPIYECCKGQLLLAYSNVELSARTIRFEVVRPYDPAEFSVVNAPGISIIGNGVAGPISQGSFFTDGTARTTDIFFITVPGDNGSPAGTCGSLIISYPVANQYAKANPARIDSRLTVCSNNTCTGGVVTTLWPFNIRDGKGFIWPVTQTRYFSNQQVDEFALANGGAIVLNGTCTYKQDYWQTGTIGNNGPTFVMTPSARLSFERGQYQSTNLTIPQIWMIPCELQRHNGISVGEGVTLNIQESTTDGVLISYSNTGITVKQGGGLNLNGGHISLATTGVSIANASTTSIKNADIDQIVEDQYLVRNPVGLGIVNTNGADGIKVYQDTRTLPGQPAYILYVDLLIEDTRIKSFADGIDLSGFDPEGIYTTIRRANIQTTNLGVNISNLWYSDVLIDNSDITSSTYNAFAVDMEESTLNIRNSRLTTSNTSIKATTLYPTYTGINDNTIVATEHGIDARGASHTFRAYRNTITLGSNPGSTSNYAAGIGLYQSVNNQNIIDGNQITLPPGRKGIGVSTVGSGQTAIVNNAVRTKYSLGAGIAVEGGQNNEISCNLVKKDANGASPLDHSGVVTQNINNVFANCNTLEDTKYGLQMLGVSPLGHYRANTFRNNTYGLAVGLPYTGSGSYQVLIGGVQSFRDNLWYGSNTGAIHYADQQYKMSNRFFLRHALPYYPSVGVDNDWFVLGFTGANPQACPGGCASTPPGWFDSPPPGEEEGGAARTQAARSGYASGKLSESGINQSTTNELARIEAFVVGYNKEPQDATTYNKTQELLVSYWNSKEISVISNKDFRSLLYGEKKSRRLYSRRSQSTIDSLVAEIRKIRTSDEMEKIWQDALILVSKSYRTAGLGPEDSLAVDRIAQMCSEIDGPGVNIARLISTTPYHDVFNCATNVKKLHLEFEELPTLFTMSPSYTISGSVLTFSKPFEGSLQLFSSIGRVVSVYPAELRSSLKLPDNLQPGVYFIGSPSNSDGVSIKLIIHE